MYCAISSHNSARVRAYIIHLAAAAFSTKIPLSVEQWHILRPKCFPCHLDARALLRRDALSTAQPLGVHVLPNTLGPHDEHVVSVLQLGLLFELHPICGKFGVDVIPRQAAPSDHAHLVNVRNSCSAIVGHNLIVLDCDSPHRIWSRDLWIRQYNGTRRNKPARSF